MEPVGSRKSVLEAGICSEVLAEHGHVRPDTGLGYYGGTESISAGLDLWRAVVEQGLHGGVD